MTVLITRKPRRDVVVRRFIDGMSIREIVLSARGSGLRHLDVEDAIRWALNRKPRGDE